MAARPVWYVALGLGVLGTGFGAKLVSDQYDFYRPKDLPPTFAIFGVGLVLLSLGLAKVARPLVGVVAFVVLAGAAGVMIKLGMSRMEEMQRGWAQERVVQEAAEKVCRGTPNAAAGTGGAGANKIMQVISRPDGDAPDLMFVHPWKELPAPTTLEELQLVVCRVQRDEYVSSCDYSSASGADTYTIRKYKSVDTLTVRDARTGAALGEQTFEGGMPSEKCDESVTTSRGGSTSSRARGDDPSEAAETAFVRSFVERAEK
jgi:hypothetical protein